MINIAARDLFLNALAFCLLVLIIILPWINPVPAQTEDLPPPGNIIVTITWPEGRPDDVDLWVKSPDDGLGVGYSRKDGGTAFALLRDDLGNPTPLNSEMSVSHTVPDGEYTVNLHLYKGTRVSVKVEIILFPPRGSKVELFNETVELFTEGQERTVLSWRMRDGKVVPFSMNRVFKPVRGAGK
jgi:hypothetical protein